MSLSISTLQQKRWRKELRRREIHDRMGRNGRLPKHMRMEGATPAKDPVSTMLATAHKTPEAAKTETPKRSWIGSKFASLKQKVVPKRHLPQKVVAS